MTSEIIDQASALEEMMRDHAFRLTDSTTQQYQQRTVRSAATSYSMRAGKRIRDARCASSARAIWNCVRRLGGCDAAINFRHVLWFPHVLVR